MTPDTPICFKHATWLGNGTAPSNKNWWQMCQCNMVWLKRKNLTDVIKATKCWSLLH